MVKSGQVWRGMFPTLSGTGAVTTPTVGPTGALYVNGVLNAATVTITGSNPYFFSVTLPTLVAGDTVSMYMTATISGVPTAAVVTEDIAVTKWVSDLNDIAAGAVMTLTAAYDAAKTAASQASVDDLPTNSELATALAGADDAVLAAIGALNNLSSAGAQAAAAAALAAYGVALQTSVDDLEGRLTAARAGYLDNLSGGAVALEATLTAIKGAGWSTETLAAIGALASAILADTNELQTDWKAGGRLDVKLEAADTPTAGEIADAVLDEDKGTHTGWLTTLATAAAMAVVDAVVDAIKAKTDLIDVSNILVDAPVVEDVITAKRWVTLDTGTIPGLSIPVGWTQGWFTVKADTSDADSEALIQIVVSNPGAGTDGLIVLDGAAAADKTAGSLALDAGAGTAAAVVSDEALGSLEDRAGLAWDIKVKVGTTSRTSQVARGTMNLGSAVTRSV